MSIVYFHYHTTLTAFFYFYFLSCFTLHFINIVIKNLRLHAYECLVYLLLVSTTFNILSHDSNEKLLNGLSVQDLLKE